MSYGIPVKMPTAMASLPPETIRRMTESLKNGNNEVSRANCKPPPNPFFKSEPGPNKTTVFVSSRRPGWKKIQEIGSDESRLNSLGAVESMLIDADEQKRIIWCNVLRRIGDTLKEDGKHDAAMEKYSAAIREIAGAHGIVPSDVGVRVEAYIRMTHWDRIDLMACCNAMAACFEAQGKLDEALDWLEEVNVIYKNTRYSIGTPLFPWTRYDPEVTEHYIQYLTSLSRAGDIFFKLGNTSAACNRYCTGMAMIDKAPAGISRDELRKVLGEAKGKKVAEYRHPDPEVSINLTVTEPSLQIQGSWKKIVLKQPGGMAARMGFGHFVWNSHLYIFGGEWGTEGPFYEDFWCLDLKKMDKWRQLPAYWLPASIVGHYYGWSFSVYEDKAYMFTGLSIVDCFDLKKEKWSSIKCTFEGPGEFPVADKWVDFTTQTANGKLYVFGGTWKKSQLGCNVLLELDIRKQKWRLLSGTSMPTQDDLSPGPRRYTSSWVDKKQENLFILYGEADRQGAMIHAQLNADANGFGYDDFWSWNFKEKKWTRQKIHGNSPCARSEMGTTYNPMLDKVITWGGYCPGLTTRYKETNEWFDYTYFADTYLFDPSTSRWKQVLTRGFPTYRALGHLFTDPSTGKIFMFGGYTNTEYVPSRHLMSRAFGDIWQLRLDMSGGYFEGIDIEEEARTAKAGPWRRCFNCGGAGYWKRCSGTCGGRAHFCDVVCQKEGWKTHKEMHNCRPQKK